MRVGIVSYRAATAAVNVHSISYTGPRLKRARLLPSYITSSNIFNSHQTAGQTSHHTNHHTNHQDGLRTSTGRTSGGSLRKRHRRKSAHRGRKSQPGVPAASLAGRRQPLADHRSP